MDGLLLACAFALATGAAGGFVPSLPMPFAYFPLLLTCGVLVMHRVGTLQGVAWLLLAGVALELLGVAPGRLLAFWCAAGVGALAVERIFAKRSVYALLGLGGTIGITFLAVEWARSSILGLFDDTATRMRGYEAVWTLLLLFAGLYSGFVVVVTVRKWVQRTFVVR